MRNIEDEDVKASDIKRVFGMVRDLDMVLMFNTKTQETFGSSTRNLFV